MAIKKILMACCNYWTSPIHVGSHQLAKAFVQSGYQVAFISDPISPLHLLKGISTDFKERFKIFKKGGVWNEEHTIWTYVPATMATPHNKPFLRSEWLQNNWNKLTFPSLIKKIKQNGFGSVDYLYIDNANQSFLLDVISYKKSICRIADKNSGFGKATASSIRLEKQLIQRVDTIAYTAKSLESYILSMRKHAFYLPNGVNYSHFSGKNNLVPIEYQSIKKPIVLYVGSMDFWFDYECINVAAQTLSDIAFVLVGPSKLARQRLMRLPNIHLLGRRAYKDLPPYMQHADIGIIPFDRKNYAELIDHVNPLKLYEYMAAGLPVVSTRWQELESQDTPAKLVDTHDDFIKKIKEIIQEPTAKEELQAFASKFEWSKLVKKLL